MSDKPVGVKRTRHTADDKAEYLRAAKKKKVKEIWAHNQSDAVKLNFVWTIETFSLLSLEVDKEICSPEFSFRRDMNRWRLKLYPKGQHSCQGFMAVYLFKSSNSKRLPTALPTTFEITLLSSEQQVLTSYSFDCKMFADNSSSFVKGLLKVEDVFSKCGLPTDKLHIHCQVHYETKKTVIPQSSTTAAINVLTREENPFYQPMAFSDLEIQVRGVSFSAQKSILAAGSPVYSAMFQSDVFTEQKTNILKIYDLEPPVVKEMLRFMYTGRVEKMDELAIGLLMAADKYLIDQLKTQCQAALTETVTVENCCQLLALADSYSASQLKTVATRFVIQHPAEVSTTVGWKVLKQTHSHLGFQLFEANRPVTETQPAAIKRELNKQKTVPASKIEQDQKELVMESDSKKALFKRIQKLIDSPAFASAHRCNSGDFPKKPFKRPFYLPLWQLENTISYCYSQVVTNPMTLRQYRPFSSEVYGEASFANIAKMIKMVNIQEDEVFIDLGSGIGQVVIQVAASTVCKKAVGIEFKEIPSRYAKDLSNLFNDIVKKTCKRCSPYELIHGDFLDEQYSELIASANVIFMNNVLFDSYTINQLKVKFQNLEDGTRIVVTNKFPRYSDSVNERNCLDLTSILTAVAKFDGEASWSAKHVTFYVYIVDRTKVKKFFDSRT